MSIFPWTMKFERACFLFFALLLAPPEVFAEHRVRLVSEGTPLVVEPLAEGLAIPWGLAFLDDRNLLITERRGTLKLLDITTGNLQTIAGVKPVWAKGQGGLMDVALRWPYRAGDWIYLSYSKATPQGAATTLARARLQKNRLYDWDDILVTQSVTDTSRHFGGRILLTQKALFLTVGDRGHRPNGQRLDTHAGKILRLDFSGCAKKDNPFVNQTGALPEIWSFGHRNPQGITYDPVTRIVWAIEHGPRGGDEINQIKAGLNYGWPVVSHGKEYWGPFRVGEATEKPGMENPIKVYIPSIAPSSLLFYTGHKIPVWRGNLLAGALAKTHLNRIVLNKNASVEKEERLLESLGQRIRDVIQGPDEWVYFSTDEGFVYRIRTEKQVLP